MPVEVPVEMLKEVEVPVETLVEVALPVERIVEQVELHLRSGFALT
jgi:hypothetical protein